MKLIPKRNFLLRMEGEKTIYAKRGEAVEVTDDEWKRLSGTYFTKPYPQKKGMSVK